MRPFPERNRRNRDFLHGVACGVCLVSGSLTINDMMHRKGTPRCGDEKNAPCRPKGTERRRSAVPLSCFTRSGQYRGPYGGHCPSRSRTHFPPAAQRAAFSGAQPLSACLTRVLFPFIAVVSSVLYYQRRGGVSRRKWAGILRKSDIQNPVHRFNFPMLASKFHELFGTGIPAGNVIAGFPAAMSANLYNPFNRKMDCNPGHLCSFNQEISLILRQIRFSIRSAFFSAVWQISHSFLLL